MRTIGIRNINGPLIKEAAGQGEVLGITSGRVLSAVLLPLGEGSVERLVAQNRARIELGIAHGEEQVAAGNASDLDDLVRESGIQEASPKPLPRLPIRKLTGGRLEQAADEREILVVTHGRDDLAILVPVTSQLVEHLVERNLSRIQASIERGETEILRDGASTLDELLEDVGEGQPEARREGKGFKAPQASLVYERVIGIKIIPDAPGEDIRLVGVETDVLGRISRGPVERPLASLDVMVVVAGVLELVTELQARMAPEERLVGVGLQVGGHVDQGTVIYSPNADWRHVRIAPLLEEHLSLPVVLENDANALAVRERRVHGVTDENMAVVLITNRGIGSSLIVNGQVARGSHGMAGELGHIAVEFDSNVSKIKCRCGTPGCLEGAAAPYALLSSLADDAGFHGDLGEALTVSDGAVRDILRQAGEALGRAVATVINLLNPSTIVLYGPADLVGKPGTFRGYEFGGGADNPYVAALARAARDQSFSTGLDECRFIVRHTDEAEEAASAAAPLIQHLVSKKTMHGDTMGARESPDPCPL